MRSVANQLSETVCAAKPRLLAISERARSEKPLCGQVVGEGDSRAPGGFRGQQPSRIVRMQNTRDIGSPVRRSSMVEAREYQSRPWDAIVEFWCQYNLHRGTCIGEVDPRRWSTSAYGVCRQPTLALRD